MLYQEKPKELKRFEALCITSDTTVEDIAKWVVERSGYFDLLRYFKLKGELWLEDRRILDDMYLICENGKYRLLDKEVFEGMYEPIPNETA